MERTLMHDSSSRERVFLKIAIDTEKRLLVTCALLLRDAVAVVTHLVGIGGGNQVLRALTVTDWIARAIFVEMTTNACTFSTRLKNRVNRIRTIGLSHISVDRVDGTVVRLRRLVRSESHGNSENGEDDEKLHLF